MGGQVQLSRPRERDFLFLFLVVYVLGPCGCYTVNTHMCDMNQFGSLGKLDSFVTHSYV